MINKRGIQLILTVVVSVGLSLFYNELSKEKIAYVRVLDVLDNYQAMTDARMVYEKKQSAWSSQRDSIERNFQLQYQNYQFELPSLTKELKVKKEENLVKLREMSARQIQAIEQEAQQQDESMTQGVLDRLNLFLERYGKDRGYTIIFGTDASGTILYASDAVDVTVDVISGLNAEYLGQ